jgi:hypothetical protein
VARTERDIVIHTAIFAEGNFAFGASVEIVEDGAGNAALGDGTQVGDADYAGGGDGA